MGSRGSVIPYFLKKRKDGVLPLTDARMTRFNITLQEGVDFVISCFEKMWGGELFVPKIPSYRVVDVAKAIAPNAKHEIVGIRPGEKLHEEMITVTDSINTVEFDDYYVITPNSDYLSWNKKRFLEESNESSGSYCEDGFSYDSGKNDRFLTVGEIKELIIKNIPGSSAV